MSPMVLPQTWEPIRCADWPPGNLPARNARSPSRIRRATASIRPKFRSAVASVVIGAVTVTGMRRSVAAVMSMFEGVIDCAAIKRSSGLAVTTARSILSWSRQNKISARRTSWRSVRAGIIRLVSEKTLTFATARRRLSAVSDTGWVTKIRGRRCAVHIKARLDQLESRSVRNDLFAHDLIRKPVSTFRGHALGEPPHDAGDAVDRNLRAVGNAPRGIKYAEHRGDAALARQRSKMRGRAAKRGDHRAARAPADAGGMAVQPGMFEPDFVRHLRRPHVQRPRLQQFETVIAQRPFDLNGHAERALGLAHQPAERGGLAGFEARGANERRRHGLRRSSGAVAGMAAGLAMMLSPRIVGADEALPAEYDAVRHHFALGDGRAQSPRGAD